MPNHLDSSSDPHHGKTTRRVPTNRYWTFVKHKDKLPKKFTEEKDDKTVVIPSAPPMIKVPEYFSKGSRDYCAHCSTHYCWSPIEDEDKNHKLRSYRRDVKYRIKEALSDHRDGILY